MVITIDGLCVNGKTTLAKKIAKKINFKYFSAGTIYRCIALEIINKKLDINDIDNIIKEISNIKIDISDEKIILNGTDVTDEIRTSDVTIKSNKWATIPEIKQLVRSVQKEFIKSNDTVMEGRDIATRIAPNADMKFYLYSDFEKRVERVLNENSHKSKKEAEEYIKRIDDVDINEGNFVRPENAIEIDTSNLTLDEVYKKMISEINKLMDKKFMER